MAVRGERVKLERVLGSEARAVATLGATELRALREAVSARLFDDAKPVLQRMAAGARILPNGMVARIGERVFGAMLCSQMAGLLPPAQALEIALKMPDAFLAQVSAAIDPRTAGEVVAAIPAVRIVAVAHVLLAQRDFVTLARFVDYLSRDTIGAVIDSIPDELELLRIAAYVESSAKLAELVGQLAPARTRAMIGALHGANAALWLEAFAVGELVDAGWRRTLGDLAAELDPAVLEALVETATRLDVWPAALPLLAAMSDANRHRVLARPALSLPPAIRAALA